MIHIEKGPEPLALVEHRASPNATYADFRGGDALRAALAKEQGQLCAYCTQRIVATIRGMKIEHWYPQNPPSVDPGDSRPAPTPRGPLDFRNMLGVCHGGEHGPPPQQHCDTSKGNRLLTIDPLDRPERHIRYGADGSIQAKNPTLQSDLDEVLNLNLDRLKHNRKSAWDGAHAALVRGGAQAFRAAALRRQLDRLGQVDHTGKRLVHCGYVAFFLAKKLRSVQAVTKSR